MKAIPALMLLGAGLVLVGCSDEGYRCKKPTACDPVYGNYESAIHDSSRSGWKTRRYPAGASSTSPPVSVQADAGNYVQPTPETPIYVPPHPWRAWFAPYARGDGTLDSGSYVWFTTPGHWSFLGHEWPSDPGPTAAEVQDDSMLHPVSPTDLGFTPSSTAKPTKPGEVPTMTQPDADKNGSAVGNGGS